MGYPNLWGLLICTGEDCWAPVPLEGIAVSVTVRGFVAQVKATLRYKNDCKSPMEVMFKCPCDEGSAIYHVEAKINDRTIIGRCLEKKKAEEVYQEAVAAGRTALLVREDARTADIISLALGNLPPDSTAKVTLSLVCDLTVAADGGVQFTLPTLLNPRYNPVDGPTEDPHVSSGQGYFMTVSKPYAIEVTASVTGGQSIARVISHTDPINVAIEEDSKQAKITLDGGAFRTDHDWSFVVYYNNPYHPHALVETGDSTELGLMKDQVLMINMFPELPEGSYSHYNEVIFIIDRSGSMGGENIQNARAVLLLFLKSLPPGCRFNVISFGSHHTLLFPEGSREYNEANLALALKLHETMDADMGGTEILQPLKTVYSKPADPEYSRQILLLTDGQVFNVDQVTELAERNAGNTRVFAVGIGDGASTALIKGLARAGGGRAELVTQRDRMQTKVMGLVSSMLQSSVRKVSVSCELDTPARLRLVPEVPPTIFAGQHLITYARMPPSAQLKSIKLTGTVDGLPWSASLSREQVTVVHDASLALHRLAAKALIRHSYTDDSDGAREEMIALSTRSGVLSRYTALVAVDQDGKAFQAPKVNVPQYQQQCFGLIPQFMGGVGLTEQSRGMCMIQQQQQTRILPMAHSNIPVMKSYFSAAGSSLFENAPPLPPSAFGGMKFGCANPLPSPPRGAASTQAFGAFPTDAGNSASLFGASSSGGFSFGASAPASQERFVAASSLFDGAFESTAFAPEPMASFKFGVQPQMSDSVDCSMETESDDVDCGRQGGSLQNAALDDDEVTDCTDSKSATEEAVSSPEDVLMGLITCQKFDGSWKLDDVAKALAVDCCDLQKSETKASDESNLATGLAIVILQEGFSDKKEEWQLLANKAKSFLQHKLGAAKLNSNITLESFLESLKQLLKNLTVKYPNLASVMTMK